MSAQDNATAIRSFNEAYNDRDSDRAISLCTPDVEIISVATGQTFLGPDGVRQFLQGWATAFPDSRVETKKVIADEQGAVIEFDGKGTQTGPLAGPAGEIPPTGKYAEQSFCVVADMRDGKIARSRQYFDLVSLLQQLGAIPQPAAAGA